MHPRFQRWAWVSPAEFVDFKEQNHVFDEVPGGLPEESTLSGNGMPPEDFWAIRMTPNTYCIVAQWGHGADSLGRGGCGRGGLARL